MGLFLLFVGGIILTVGDIVSKVWVEKGNMWFYWIGLTIYMIGMNFLMQSFKFKNIAVASMIFVLFNIITLSLISWFYFKEKLSVIEIIGICLGLASVIILEIKE